VGGLRDEASDFAVTEKKSNCTYPAKENKVKQDYYSIAIHSSLRGQLQRKEILPKESE
jgi:hypothetical protein